MTLKSQLTSKTVENTINRIDILLVAPLMLWDWLSSPCIVRNVSEAAHRNSHRFSPAAAEPLLDFAASPQSTMRIVQRSASVTCNIRLGARTSMSGVGIALDGHASGLCMIAGLGRGRSRSLCERLVRALLSFSMPCVMIVGTDASRT